MHTPPSYATPPSERDVTLLSVGQQCAHPSCLLVDFLPLKCIHCKLAFCQDHFRAQAHSCTEYDESAHNRVAPDCPLCNTPVAVRPGQDPNARMEQHFASECSVTTGRTKPANSFPHCAKPSCNKVLFSPIRCDKCKAQFCPAHRFPSDHKCVTSHSAVSSSASQASNTLAAMVANAKNVNSKAVAASTAIKRSVAATSASVGKPAIAASPVKSVPPAKSTPQSKPAPSTKQAHNNPFSKVDRLFASSTPDNDINDRLKRTHTATTDLIISDIANMDAGILPVTSPCTTPTNGSPKLKTMASPAIDPMSFVPPPIFASA